MSYKYNLVQVLCWLSMWQMCFSSLWLFFFLSLFILREREREQAGEGHRERIPSRFHAVIVEPDMALDLTTMRPEPISKVGNLTDRATQAPLWLVVLWGPLIIRIYWFNVFMFFNLLWWFKLFESSLRNLRCLASSVNRAHNSWSRGYEFEPHIGGRVYFFKKRKKSFPEANI